MERYRIEVASANPFTDGVVANHAQQLAEELDHAGANTGAVVVRDAAGAEVAAWRFGDQPDDGLDAQVDAAWQRLRQVSQELRTLTLRRVARTVAAQVTAAASLHLVVRDPDDVGEPERWLFDHVSDADRQPIALPEEVADELHGELRDDLDSLAFLADVDATGTVDLTTDPPTLTTDPPPPTTQHLWPPLPTTQPPTPPHPANPPGA
jgi:hypothetical protein